MRIATWNINSVRLRVEQIGHFTAEFAPDILCLQEIKVTTDLFPAAAMREIGFRHQHVLGMKSYNGVAVLSRLPFKATGGERWCGKDDSRHAWVELRGGVELHNYYVPAGGDVPDPETNAKFAHKLHFMTEMANWWAARKDPARKAILVGDLNVAPLETDVWSHKQLLRVVSHTPIEVEHYRRVAAAHDWVDAVRHFVPEEEKLFSWWSYRSPDWTENDRGRRLDHIWVTPALAPKLKRAQILRELRSWQQPSDHVPVMIDIAI
ncbi:MAG: exodeoxyribonuclease III [Alphaproteobacteria bacterium]|nr:exodeoxyribonuclease III [Alphaproteobacteria bacterium]